MKGIGNVMNVYPVVLILLLTICFMPSAAVAGEGSVNPGNNDGFAVVNGAKFYYRVMGEGAPLIFLHGGPGMFHEYFLPHVEPLANDFKLIFYDQRASGNSSRNVPPESVNPENFVKDLDGIREYFGLEKVSLLGHSWGGLLALRYALTFPDRVERLILVDSAPPNSTLDTLNIKAREERRTEEDFKIIQEITGSEAFQKLEIQAVKRYLQVSEKVKFFNPDLISELKADLNKEKIEKLMWVAQLMNPFLEEYDIAEDLSAITCSTLIIHGDHDTIPLESAEIIHRQVRGSKLVVVKDCGHFPFIEAPEIFSREVISFMGKNSKH
jgi:proline iminopeptidase